MQKGEIPDGCRQRVLSLEKSDKWTAEQDRDQGIPKDFYGKSGSYRRYYCTQDKSFYPKSHFYSMFLSSHIFLIFLFSLN